MFFRRKHRHSQDTGNTSRADGAVMLEMTRRLAHEQPPIADGTEAIAAAAPSVASGLHAGPHGGTLDEQLVQQEHGRSRQEEQ